MPSMTQILIILVIVVLVFGTKKLRNMGSDLGEAVKGFKKGMNEDEQEQDPKNLEQQEKDQPGGRTVEGEVTEKQEEKK